jgi:eukaryotic-like serine/threonine-protein kinase
MARIPSKPEPDDSVGAVLDGRFRVLRHLGRGGTGTVHEVEDLAYKRVAALKVIHSQYAESREIARRFLLEAAAAQRVESLHVVQVQEAGRFKDGRPFILMELLRGQALSAHLRDRGPLPLQETLTLCLQAARGLVAAHAAGIVHRDIKPDNLFVLDSTRTLVKILDFGISKFLYSDAPPLTREGRMLGTFSYMAPEQMRGATDVDERADIYSLGIVLYECLVGRPPFVAQSVPSLAQLVVQGQFTSVASQRSDVPPEVDAFLTLCLARNRADRCPTMQVFHDRLSAVGQEKLVAQPIVSIGASALPAARPWLDENTMVPGSSAPGTLREP